MQPCAAGKKTAAISEAEFKGTSGKEVGVLEGRRRVAAGERKNEWKQAAVMRRRQGWQ